MATRFHSFIPCLLIALFVQVRPAGAGPNPLAKYKPKTAAALARFTAGNESYKAGLRRERPLEDRVRDLHAAIEQYEAGAALEDAPAFDYNWAHTARALDDRTTAVQHLLRFLERTEAGDDALRATLQREVTELDPTGSISAELRRKQAEAAAKPVQQTTPARVEPAATPQEPPHLQAEHATNAAGHGWSYLGWGLTAAGLAASGVSALLYVSAPGLKQDSMDISRTTAERQELERRYDARRNLALGVGIGGGVALVLGVVTLAIPARHASQSSSQVAEWRLGFTGNGVVVHGRF